MKNPAIVVPFEFESYQVRTVMQNDEPWFVAVDVCSILGIRNPSDALRALDYDEKNTLDITEGIKRGNPNVNVISESGLYALIFKSRKSQAKKFQRWVTKEVLPSIRKTGSYALGDRQTTLLEAEVTEGASLIGQIIGQEHLPDHHRWCLVDRLLTELFGQGVELLSGKEGEIPLGYRCWGTKLPLLQLKVINGERWAYVAPEALHVFITDCCVVSAKSASSQKSMYAYFAAWWCQYTAIVAPDIDTFCRSMGHRTIALFGEPWFIGVAPQSEAVL